MRIVGGRATGGGSKEGKPDLRGGDNQEKIN